MVVLVVANQVARPMGAAEVAVTVMPVTLVPPASRGDFILTSEYRLYGRIRTANQ